LREIADDPQGRSERVMSEWRLDKARFR
jgi:hypothetical protein